MDALARQQLNTRAPSTHRTFMVDNLVFVLSSNRPNVKLAGAESSESLSETILADCPAAEAARTARPLVAPHALINAYV